MNPVGLRAIHENCSGCGVCRLVCALENHRETNPAKAALKIKGRFPAPGNYRIHLCDQCGQCAEICPAEAIGLENGVYLIDEKECTGCMACVEACPHEVLFVHSSSEIPFKCTLCGECAEFCPTGALTTDNNES